MPGYVFFSWKNHDGDQILHTLNAGEAAHLIAADGALRMAMYRLLRAEAEPAGDQSFSPEEVAQLTEAYEFVLATLELRDRDDPITDLIARKIINLFGRGERNTLEIYARAIKELGVAIRNRS